MTIIDLEIPDRQQKGQHAITDLNIAEIMRVYYTVLHFVDYRTKHSCSLDKKVISSETGLLIPWKYRRLQNQ